ncbi:MAG: hypothetical protein ABI702_12495 [Burkholderiales bacterium]
MSISVHGVGRIAPQSAETPAPASTTASIVRSSTGAGAVAVEIDETTNLPKLPRYPWLSRLSAQLEPAAKQKPAFPSAPPLGENIDAAA